MTFSFAALSVSDVFRRLLADAGRWNELELTRWFVWLVSFPALPSLHIWPEQFHQSLRSVKLEGLVLGED
jgi:hypothetical protein